MGKVRLQVKETTSNQQQPWETSSLTSKFYFKPEEAQTTVTKPTDSSDARLSPMDLQIMIWGEINNIRDPEQKYAALKQFVARYPGSLLRHTAEDELAKLEIELQRQRELETSLQECENYRRYNRLSEATACYQEVLDRDRGNVNALGSLEQIIETYATRAEDALERDLLDQAKIYLERIAQINPEHPRLLELRARASDQMGPISSSSTRTQAETSEGQPQAGLETEEQQERTLVAILSKQETAAERLESHGGAGSSVEAKPISETIAAEGTDGTGL